MSTPNNSWFYVVGDRAVGPVTVEQLLAASLAGVVRPETPVRRGDWPGWHQAAQVPDLQANFGADPHSPAEQQAAPCIVPVSTSAPAYPSAAAGPRSKGKYVRRRRRKDLASAMASLLLGAAAIGIAVVAVWFIQASFHSTDQPVVQASTSAEHDDRWDRVADQWARNRGRERDDRSLDIPEWGLNARAAADHHHIFELPGPPQPRGPIDELVFAKWEQKGIKPANPCSDGVFLRRAYLDVIGTLPTVEEAREFLKDESPDKRARLIDSLLDRPEYADFWAMRWSDVLRVKAEFPINLWPNAAQAYHRYIYHSMATNKPYDQFARELLTSTGSNFRNGEVNFFRAVQNHEPATLARAAALAFMGERIENWPEERRNGLAGFFAKVGFKPTREWKEEIVVFDPLKSGEASLNPVLPDGTAVEIPWDKDPRVVLADWLITPENPWFARQIVNRLWFWLLGRGIVHEPDDVRPDNPPSNPELLNWLAQELVNANYDMKHICRLILNSSTYQLSSIPKSTHPEAEAQFAAYRVRRLEAEVMIDAINQITGTTESYSSIIPEPYTFIPETMRAIALPDGSIISSFLELFGRPPRDTGLLSERNNGITAGQRLHMLNSSHIRNKIRGGPGIRELAAQGDGRETLYLGILSRFPTDEDGVGSREELAWMLLNTTEFMFRH